MPKSINQFMKTNKNKNINGKMISTKKKEYMNIIISFINNSSNKVSINDTLFYDIVTSITSNQYTEELNNKIINYFIKSFIFNR